MGADLTRSIDAWRARRVALRKNIVLLSAPIPPISDAIDRRRWLWQSEDHDCTQLTRCGTNKLMYRREPVTVQFQWGRGHL